MESERLGPGKTLQASHSQSTHSPCLGAWQWYSQRILDRHGEAQGFGRAMQVRLQPVKELWLLQETLLVSFDSGVAGLMCEWSA